MKKIIALTIIFIIYAVLIKTCPIITVWDKSVIVYVQNMLSHVPLYLLLLPDCKLYVIMLSIPMIFGFAYFFKRKDWYRFLLLISISAVAFLINCILKSVVCRIRPPYELQLAIHPDSYSFVSSHSLTTMCLYGLTILYVVKYCSNKFIRILTIVLSISWILFVGISRIWLGVHYPTDVIGAYLLGFIILMIYYGISKR